MLKASGKPVQRKTSGEHLCETSELSLKGETTEGWRERENENSKKGKPLLPQRVPDATPASSAPQSFQHGGRLRRGSGGTLIPDAPAEGAEGTWPDPSFHEPVSVVNLVTSGHPSSGPAGPSQTGQKKHIKKPVL